MVMMAISNNEIIACKNHMGIGQMKDALTRNSATFTYPVGKAPFCNKPIMKRDKGTKT